MDTSDQPSTLAAASCNTIRLQRELRKRKQENTEDTDFYLFCEQLDTRDDILHSFQKVELTEEFKNKALLIGDSNFLKQVSVFDVVANELKYNTACYVLFNRRYDAFAEEKQNQETAAESRVMEEILAMVEDELATGRRYFPLKTLYQQATRRAELYHTITMNLTRFKNSILQRFSTMLEEEQGFCNEVIPVSSMAMEDVVQHSLLFVVPSEDYRIMSKAALICRGEMCKLSKFDFQRDGFKSDCQTQCVSNNLKLLVKSCNAETRNKCETPLALLTLE